jgi:predicted nucleotidyltransferase
MIQELTKVSRDILSKRSEIVAAYLYGSFLRGDSYNDIDIGFLLDDDFKPPALYEAKITGELEKRTGMFNFNVEEFVRQRI